MLRLAIYLALTRLAYAGQTQEAAPPGQLQCWAAGTHGAQTIGGRVATAIPAWRAFSASVYSYEMCGISYDYKIYCWDPYKDITVNLPAKNFTQLCVGRAHGCAIADDGKMSCWTTVNDGYGSPAAATNIPSTPAEWKMVACDWGTTCGIGSDDKLYCW